MSIYVKHLSYYLKEFCFNSSAFWYSLSEDFEDTNLKSWTLQESCRKIQFLWELVISNTASAKFTNDFLQKSWAKSFLKQTLIHSVKTRDLCSYLKKHSNGKNNRDIFL